jgi:hypothetical protein
LCCHNVRQNTSPSTSLSNASLATAGLGFCRPLIAALPDTMAAPAADLRRWRKSDR